MTDAAADWVGMALSLAGLGWLVAVLAQRSLRAPVALMLRYAALVALPGLVFLGGPVLLLALWLDLDLPLMQALIAGVVVAMGWLTSAIFRQLDAARDKEERLRDYHKAIYAEVQSAISGYDPGTVNAATGKRDVGEPALRIIRRMEDADNGPFIPVIPLEVHDVFYATIQDKIDILPRETIGAITFYYGVIRSIRALSEDMRAPEFRNAMDNERRMNMYWSYAEMRLRAYWAGIFVLKVIQKYSKEGKASTRKFVDEHMNRVNENMDRTEDDVASVSNPEADRTGPEAGSV